MLGVLRFRRRGLERVGLLMSVRRTEKGRFEVALFNIRV